MAEKQKALQAAYSHFLRCEGYVLMAVALCELFPQAKETYTPAVFMQIGILFSTLGVFIGELP